MEVTRSRRTSNLQGQERYHCDWIIQSPKIPPYSANLPDTILQLHSESYRNPESLPPGAVLVVGAAQSGCQIAEELYQNGRQVYLSTSTAARVPRRYRGKDIVSWLLSLVSLTKVSISWHPPRQSMPAIRKFLARTAGIA